MTRICLSGWVSTILSLSILPMPAAATRIEDTRNGAAWPSAEQASLVEIQNPGKTGLAPGRYTFELEAGGGSNNDGAILILSLAPSGRPQRHPARASGCARSNLKVLSWTYTVANRRDGSLELELLAISPRGCRVVATIPAIPGIEGSPVGTAGAPGKKAPGIEGSPVGTAGAPAKPGAGRGAPLEADRQIGQVIVKAREALPTLSCTAPRHARAELSALQSALREVADASSPAAAVQPLRRFESARQVLQKVLAADRTASAGADRCAQAERRCAASSSIASACGIDAGVCVARVACAADVRQR